jgi:hypothetical protein
VGDWFAPAPLSTDDAHALQSNLFHAGIDALQSDSSVKSYYDQNVPMKDALSVEFQSGYDSIVKSYSGPDSELTSGGMQAFETFFSNAVFTPPPSSIAEVTTSFFQNKLNSFINTANQVPANTAGSLAQRELATSMGEQAQAMAVALKQSLASILNGSTQSTQGTQNVINILLTAGEAGAGAAGPVPAIGAAILGESLKLLVASGSDSSVQNAIADLKSHGVDVSKYSSGDLQNESEGISNYDLRLAFQNGLNNTNRVLGS